MSKNDIYLRNTLHIRYSNRLSLLLSSNCGYWKLCWQTSRCSWFPHGFAEFHKNLQNRIYKFEINLVTITWRERIKGSSRLSQARRHTGSCQLVRVLFLTVCGKGVMLFPFLILANFTLWSFALVSKGLKYSIRGLFLFLMAHSGELPKKVFNFILYFLVIHALYSRLQYWNKTALWRSC